MNDVAEADEGCPYRSLIERLWAYEGGNAYADLLLPWLDRHAVEVAWLASLEEHGRDAIPALPMEDLWQLYALSCLCETLLLSLPTAQTQAESSQRLGLSMQQIEGFFARLNIVAIRPDTYSPFQHEIVRTIEAPDPYQSPHILFWHWPCFMLGSLLIQRAGITVSAGARVLAPGIADASTLYWAHARKHRPTLDLSHGWGHNSRWRTDFRRDYYLDGIWHLNVDGSVDLSTEDDDMLNDYGLSKADRIELLIHRSFVTSTKEHADLFPYKDRLSLHPSSVPQVVRPSFWRWLLNLQ